MTTTTRSHEDHERIKRRGAACDHFLCVLCVLCVTAGGTTHDHQITSANVRSVRRKCQIPMTHIKAVTATETDRPSDESGDSPRSSDQRKPSMMPTSGFSEYARRQSAGTLSVLKPIGEM